MATKGVGSIFSQGASNDPHPTLFSGQSKPTSDFLQSIFNKNTPASNLFTGGLIPPANADEE